MGSAGLTALRTVLARFGAICDTPPMEYVLVAAHAAAHHAHSGHAASTATQKRHLQEIGIAICALGAVAIVLAGTFGLRSMSRAVERGTMIVAGILLAIGFVLQVLGIHGSK